MPFYDWEAEKCFLDTVDADKFCRVMEGRKGMLFVGECDMSVLTLFCSALMCIKPQVLLEFKISCSQNGDAVSPIVLLGARGTQSSGLFVLFCFCGQA